MRIFSCRTILIVAAMTAAPAAAQAPVVPQPQLADLLRQDATLREQIGRIQLDALVARVDRTIGAKPRSDPRGETPGGIRRDLDLYAFW